jgi:hypothetical protein
VSRPPARHQKPSRQSSASPVLCDERPYSEPRYDDHRYYPAPYAEAPYRDEVPFADIRNNEVRYADTRYNETRYDDGSCDEAWYDDIRYNETRYDDHSYDEARHDDRSYADARYPESRHDDGPYAETLYADAPYAEHRYDHPYAEAPHDARHPDPRYDDGPYAEASYDETLYNDGQNDQASYDGGPHDEGPNDERRYSQGAADRSRPPSPRGTHRHARPSRMRRKPVKIAAAMAGSTLLVAGAAPVAAHWWHRQATHPTALDQKNPASTPGTAFGAGPRIPGQPAAPENTLAQWAQIPVGKHAATQASAAKRAARRATAQPSHAPSPTPTAPPSAAYQNPLRAVSDLVLERVDMGVDFGGAGPVYALGDGVITNATGDSSGWPGGGWITYQLTDGPDAGLVVYLAEDVKPTVQVGQKVTSSTVIADMFNGGDGIETGWATSDSSTAESQMAAAGGISGGGPFPTMVGLSFDAVLESVGVPAAPNANEAGNGLLPAGYPAVAS